MTLFMYKGLPACGKTTDALARVRKNPYGVKRVNKDDLRALLHGGEWSIKLERDILRARDTLVQTLLGEGYDVLVDDTNLAPIHEEELRGIASDLGAKFEVVDMTDVSPKVCVERDAVRPGLAHVGKKVIMDMYKKYLAHSVKRPEPPPFDPAKLECIICDIDGTVAQYSHGEGCRGPYDWQRVSEDQPRKDIIRVVKELALNRDLLFVSGRMDDCSLATEKWLYANGFGNFLLYMRKSGDMRRDSIVKREIYDTKIAPYYNVVAVIDDRPQVLNECWRPLGLPVFDVGTGEDF